MCLGIINSLSTFGFSWLSDAKTLQDCLCGFDHRQSKKTLCSFQRNVVTGKVRVLFHAEETITELPCICNSRSNSHQKLSLATRGLVFNVLICIFVSCPLHVAVMRNMNGVFVCWLYFAASHFHLHSMEKNDCFYWLLPRFAFLRVQVSW